ncbi:MAG TPA: DUF1444 family protein [Blastocatellia bacterium]|nr:DUF1444 family protein [Blastocatellia bacterium]
MTPEQYKQHVLTLLRAAFPESSFEDSPDPFIITCGDAQIGLQNLYSVYTGQRLEAPERDAHIHEHFSNLIETLRERQHAESLTWEEARDKLRVQFSRTEIASGMPVLSYAFTDELSVVLVLDLPRAYSFVRHADRERWNVTEEVLYEQAVSNLEAASVGIEIHGTEGPDRLLAIQTMDGYDAARLLTPGLRQLAIEHLGEPCSAAIPNRDFIILWSRSNTKEFQGFVREKVAQDFASQPYPLTSAIFVVTGEGVKTESNA